MRYRTWFRTGWVLECLQSPHGCLLLFQRYGAESRIHYATGEEGLGGFAIHITVQRVSMGVEALTARCKCGDGLVLVHAQGDLLGVLFNTRKVRDRGKATMQFAIGLDAEMPLKYSGPRLYLLPTAV
jgi:hypothetical protein